MTAKSVFEILGPVMVGPSSSHTAGAVRIGRIARNILNEEPAQAAITLYGSFAMTYKGHGTDRALVGGLLDMDTDDVRIKDALDIATARGLVFTFDFAHANDLHPNTAGLLLTGSAGRKVFVEGSSVGGGNVIITKVNDFTVNVTGRYPAMLVKHRDKPGVIGQVTTVLGQNNINIGQMTMSRDTSGPEKLMVVETDHAIPENVLETIRQLPHVSNVVKIGPV